MRLLVRFLRPYWRQVALVVALLIVQAFASLFLPELNADIIDNGIARGDIDHIAATGGLMIGVTVLLGVVSIVAVYVGSKAAAGFGRDLRAAIFRRVQGFSLSELNRFGTPSLITRNTNDVQQVQAAVLVGLNTLASAPILAIGSVIMALRQDVPLSGLIVVVVPLIGVVLGWSLARILPVSASLQARIDGINRLAREYLSGVRVIRAFVRTSSEERRFDVVNRDLAATHLTYQRLFAIMLPGVVLVSNLAEVGVVWLGAVRVDAGAMQIGNLTAFLQYILQLLLSITLAALASAQVPRAVVAAKRILEVLDTEPSVADSARPVVPADPTGAVEFRSVDFGYPGAEDPVLRGVSFTIRPGEVTAIVGSTGSGKSTLVNLIPRFYDASAGSVLVDGVDVRAMASRELRQRIGFVPQRSHLFSGTVASNLRYGDPGADDEDLWRVLRIAQAEEFVAEMSGRLEAPIDQGGTNVSGGQRQRLTIARALAIRPRILVFDDSFSALDYRTESRLRTALRTEAAGATVIVVAQRVGTIRSADRIVVIDDGRVVGIGGHDDLMATCDTYREIVESQATEGSAS